MTDAPAEVFRVPQLDENNKIPLQFLPSGLGGSGITITTDASGFTVLTVAEGSTAARLITNSDGYAVLTVTGA
ncbi:hypothetical protein [Clavibacter zhangzhiyongii]|uniref:hypothetical protein n=1 Tax=Clavibacter zhangzhiyongii TaxID=2768071 RepID=UPI0039E01338